MKRIESADNVTDVLERIVDQGIVLDPWVRVCLSELDRLHRYRWVVDCRILGDGACERRKAA